MITNESIAQQNKINLWTVYGICLLISAVFFFLFGFNSPIYVFNSDSDYHWFMTMGNSLKNGKIPYRDLFEQKGPIVYFVYAFCCLFPNPGIAVLCLEIFSMSLFFFFAYRICRKHLNEFYSLVAIPVLAFAVFTCWCRMRSGAAVEEFMLPIYAYFLLCWLEFLQEKRAWNWLRALCLGLCFGVMLWVKYTLFYFMLVPMIIWLILSIRRQQFRTVIINALCMLAGVLIITAPILLFYALYHAVDDLCYAYFYINLTAYGTTDPLTILASFGLFFTIGPAVLFFIIYGVVRFAIQYWRERTGWLLLIAFLINLFLLVYSSKLITYYYGELIPYAILGVIYVLKWLSSLISTKFCKKLTYILIVAAFILLTIPLSIITYEWGRDKEDYTPLVIAEVIKEYENTNNTQATLGYYKIGDFGFYNAANIIPNNYFFANNVIDEDRFPEMYKQYRESITNQTSDFVITQLETWNNANEHALLSQYYELYSNIDPNTPTSYHYHRVHYFYYRDYDFVLLIKKS